MVNKLYTTDVIEKKYITKNVIELRLKKHHEFSFIAGQFTQFHIPTDNTATLRSYSIASNPKESYLEFCIKIIPGGTASNFFSKITEGSTLDITEAKGRLICEADSPALSFIVTGTGIAPIYSIITDELKNKKNTGKINIIIGVRNEEDIFWADRLENLSKQHKNFKYNFTLSQPSQNWHGLKGRVTAHLENIDTEAEHFLCGNKEMIKDVKTILANKRIPANKIHFEIF